MDISLKGWLYRSILDYLNGRVAVLKDGRIVVKMADC
jgi:hypothetical protein